MPGFNITMSYWDATQVTPALGDPPSLTDVPAIQLKTWVPIGYGIGYSYTLAFIFRFGIDHIHVESNGHQFKLGDYIGLAIGNQTHYYVVLGVSPYRNPLGAVLSMYTVALWAGQFTTP